MKIPFLSFQNMNTAVRSEILESFETFFDQAWYILGKNVKEFEEQYATFNQVKYCVGLSNGLDALHLALKALKVGKGDEVIVPSNTYIATVLAVSHVGASPVLVEPREDTYNLDPEKIESAISSRTKAIMPVHLYGQACEMQQIMDIAERYHISVVEDNAQSQGACFNGKPAGAWGHINATSFYPGKNLGALGDAGAVTTDSEAFAEEIRMLRNYGSSKKYYNETEGFNMRLDECQAAFLSVKLKHLQQWTEQRRQIASLYYEALGEIKDIILPTVADGATHVYHQYIIRTEKRDALQQYLAEKGIDTMIHYPVPPHLQKAYAHLGLGKGAFPIAEEIAGTCLSLPIWPGMESNHIDHIKSVFLDYFKKS